MEAQVMSRAAHADVVVMAAAVADFRPKAPTPGKLAKSDGVPDLVLEPTTDILASLGRVRRPAQVLVGFAAESIHGVGHGVGQTSGELAERAVAKLVAKRLDLVVANDVSAPGAGFGHETNQVVVVGADGSRVDPPLGTKREIAAAVFDAVARCLEPRGGPVG
jgi:phosphopantothenoylcysteine decarboxylase/phosphopantothenate--cysteine ligase